MQSNHCLRAMAVLLATFVFAAVAATAENGRDFAGYYSLDKIAEQGGQVQVTLNLQVYNYSAADVKQAVIMLHDSGVGLVVHGSFKPIKLLPNQHDVKLSQQFIVPLREYERWQRGVNPSLFVVYRDAKGNRWERTIEVARRPAPFPF